MEGGSQDGRAGGGLDEAALADHGVVEVAARGRAGGVALDFEFAVERLGVRRQAERGEPRGRGLAQRAVAEDAAAGREMVEQEPLGIASGNRSGGHKN